MFFRRKYYRVKPEFVENFNVHFNQRLLPAQQKYGSRLVGRWMMDMEDGTVEIFAIWEYDNYEEYERIESLVRNDQEHVKRVKDWYEANGGKEHVWNSYFFEVRNEKITSTLMN
ncbi:NIPSNAP family protein [Falsibacillus albus]|uniref:Cytoplasmic protein n=1 Tax=Falsibacillus albus TaxID=2478915 RepID=A0A3L7JZR9_9BACI|nr:NIPSNAP family protein [Falsibacillus albus]RLQ96246.1 cytoplasmic protein [Falsibacillus albus]